MPKARFLAFILGAFLLSSCERYIFRNRMMTLPTNYEYAKFEDALETEYRISPDDVINAQIFTNDAVSMINIAGGGMGGRGQGQGVGVGNQISLNFRIEYDGFAKLPLYRRVYLEGLTLRQAEMLIEDKMSEFYNAPFVLLRCENRRVLLFAGDNSQVVSLQNDNTTLFEVLAQSGGLPENGRANKIKVIRGGANFSDNPEIYKIDLSRLSGITQGNLVLQGNDIIYIETRDDYIGRIFSEAAPYLAVLSSVATVTSVIFQIRALSSLGQ